MVSPASRPYIDASVPVLREHGLTITRVFYHNLFAEYPELTNLFNMGNQANGVQQQSLAAAVFAYAANIDNAQALQPVVQRIVHKHASVGIRAEHYPIVGRHLLGAIQEVLGEAATPALLAAWEEAYGELAGALVATERELYGQAGIEAGALRPMRVVEVVQQSEDVRSFTLEAADGKALPAFMPGQYLSVAVDFAEGHRQLRQYSLSDSPLAPHWRISVKRESGNGVTPAGQVSNWLHSNVKAGDILQVSHPFGDFMPDVASNEPVVLLSAGVGITPMVAALNHIARVNPSRHVIFAHAARDAAHHAHLEDIGAAKAAMRNLRVISFHERPADGDAHILPGRMEAARLPSWPRTETNVYLCGPLAFMREQWQALIAAGVSAARLHREVFGPEMLDHLG